MAGARAQRDAANRFRETSSAIGKLPRDRQLARDLEHDRHLERLRRSCKWSPRMERFVVICRPQRSPLVSL